MNSGHVCKQNDVTDTVIVFWTTPSIFNQLCTKIAPVIGNTLKFYKMQFFKVIHITMRRNDRYTQGLKIVLNFARTRFAVRKMLPISWTTKYEYTKTEKSSIILELFFSNFHLNRAHLLIHSLLFFPVWFEMFLHLLEIKRTHFSSLIYSIYRI